MSYPNFNRDVVANPNSAHNLNLQWSREREAKRLEKRTERLAEEAEKRMYELLHGPTSSTSSAASSAYLEVISTSSGKTPKPNNNRTYSFGNQSFSTKSQNPAAKTKEKSEKTGSSCIIS